MRRRTEGFISHCIMRISMVKYVYDIQKGVGCEKPKNWVKASATSHEFYKRECIVLYMLLNAGFWLVRKCLFIFCHLKWQMPTKKPDINSVCVCVTGETVSRGVFGSSVTCQDFVTVRCKTVSLSFLTWESFSGQRDLRSEIWFLSIMSSWVFLLA